MEKHSAAYAAGTTKSTDSLVARCNYRHFITRRIESFCFSASQRKAKKPKALRPLCLVYCSQVIFFKIGKPHVLSNGFQKIIKLL
jgi:hypothetical protein